MSKIEALRVALLSLLERHEQDGMLPTSARFLFYELIAQGVISKERTGARRVDQDMNDALVSLREAGRVPWGWIVDETRAIESYAGYSTIKAAVLEGLDYIYLDPWHGNAPFVLVESRSLLGVLRATCQRYRVNGASTNGQCGGFLHTDIGPALRTGQTVLYFGDWDKAGGDIENNTRRVLERIVGGRLNWGRLALTTEQVEHYDLPIIDKWVARTKSYHDAVETEALGQAEIIRLLEDALRDLLPESLEDIEARAEEQRQAIRRLLEQE